MLNYLKAFSVFLLWATIALTSHFYISNHYFNNCFSTNNTIQNKQLKEASFSLINSTNDTIYLSVQGFKITKNSALVKILPDFSTLNDTIQYYLTDYSKELLITGKYLETETTSISNTNLGLKRAEFVKETIKQYKTHSNRVQTSSKQLDASFDSKGFYSNGIEMKLNNLRPKIVDSIEASLIHRTLYIEFEDTKLISNTILADYTSKLKYYLQKYPTKEISITGHTDNLGYFDKNLIIGLNRAHKLRAYFVSYGIDFNKITTFSKGESEPITEKITEQGRSKNRRIEININ